MNKLTVLGLNLKSLECVATIKNKYKDMEITVVDENKKDWISQELGVEV